MTIKKNDYVTIEYTGMLKESGQVFDTTNEEVAKKEKIHNPKIKYGKVTICVGQHQILPAIDKAVEGKAENTKFTLELTPENAFGKKNAKLIRLIPSKVFTKQRIQPFNGLEVQIDGMNGVVRSSSGGRIMVDFNHPLAGKDIKYEIKIDNKVVDTKAKVAAYLEMTLGVKAPKMTITGDKAEIEMQIPPQITKALADRLVDTIPEIKTVEFVHKKEEKNTKI